MATEAIYEHPALPITAMEVFPKQLVVVAAEAFSESLANLIRSTRQILTTLAVATKYGIPEEEPPESAMEEVGSKSVQGTAVPAPAPEGAVSESAPERAVPEPTPEKASLVEFCLVLSCPACRAPGLPPPSATQLVLCCACEIAGVEWLHRMFLSGHRCLPQDITCTVPSPLWPTAIRGWTLRPLSQPA
ncbi:hypothetical protein G5714_006457 [Onychostoma macrolepis]|uniref:Uncharacterized protein n=1 Tax=Onychostoma macrolepis TaxID=369639 RepID=A0A7J6D405_9TELE|nr:hypothetical protein G5714_006457 [Onychostoma macrolepis]